MIEHSLEMSKVIMRMDMLQTTGLIYAVGFIGYIWIDTVRMKSQGIDRCQKYPQTNKNKLLSKYSQNWFAEKAEELSSSQVSSNFYDHYLRNSSSSINTKPKKPLNYLKNAHHNRKEPYKNIVDSVNRQSLDCSRSTGNGEGLGKAQAEYLYSCNEKQKGQKVSFFSHVFNNKFER